MYPVFKIGIDDSEPDTQWEYQSLVDFPAHMRGFEKWSSEKSVHYFADEKKRRVTGVAIAADMPIYRNDTQLGKHYVIFSPEEIEKIWIKRNRDMAINKVNVNHDSKKVIKQGAGGIFLIEQWIVDNARGMGVPLSLSKQGIRDGSLIETYQIEDEQTWKDVMAGKYNGFSIEGMFVKWPVSVKKIGEQMNSAKLDPIMRHNLAAFMLKLQKM